MQNSGLTDLTTSLILDVSSEDLSYRNVEQRVEGPRKFQDVYLETGRQKFIAFIGFVTVTVNLAALYLTVLLLPAVNAALAPLIIYLCVKNEKDIIQGETEYFLFEQQKEEYEEVKEKNSMLKRRFDELEGEAKNVTRMESKLGRKLLNNSLNTQEYIDLVKDHNTIGFKLKTTMYDISCNTILSMIMEEDLSHTDKIEGSEIDMLIYKMKNLEFLDINEYRLRNYLAFHKGDVSKMMENLKSIVKVQQNDDTDHIGVVTIKREEFLKWLRENPP